MLTELPLGGGEVETTTNLRCREEPSLSSKILLTWPPAKKLVAWAKMDGWVLVQDLEGDPPPRAKVGWSHGDYLTWLKPLDVEAGS